MFLLSAWAFIIDRRLLEFEAEGSGELKEGSHVEENENKGGKHHRQMRTSRLQAFGTQPRPAQRTAVKQRETRLVHQRWWWKREEEQHMT